MKTAFLILIASLVFVATASAQWADPGGTWSNREISRVTLGTTDRPPVPEIPAPPRAEVPCNPYATACPGVPGSPYPPVSRPSIPKQASLVFSTTPSFQNYQGCEITINVTGLSDGTVVTFQMQVVDFGVVGVGGPPWQTIATATVTGGVASIKAKSTGVQIFSFKAVSGSEFSSERLLSWIANPSHLPCL